MNGEIECVNISILDDLNYEGPHSFQVDIQSISPNVISDAAGIGLVTIVDDG